MEPSDLEEARAVRQQALRLNAKAWGLSFGLLGGLGLFASTMILVLKGGERIGPHLGLLSVFLPGYSVTVAGAFIGFVYLFVIGYAMGRLMSAIYNAIAYRRRRRTP
ncbi:MAG: hypothetical protein H0W29_09615 [Gemmatimonadales bacterium]|nr:hypothetical protein [Gemmatimonadales bacterium]